MGFAYQGRRLSLFGFFGGGAVSRSYFLDAYGPAHTRQKVAFTLARLSLEGRSRLAQLRLRPAIQRLVDELLPGIAPPAIGLPPPPAAVAPRPFSRPMIPR